MQLMKQLQGKEIIAFNQENTWVRIRTIQYCLGPRKLFLCHENVLD